MLFAQQLETAQPWHTHTHAHTLHYIISTRYIAYGMALHSIATSYITLQFITLHYVALRYIAITVHCITLPFVAVRCVMFVRTLHSLTLHWIALDCTSWQYSVYYLALLCSIPMHDCLQTYFTENVEINWKTDKQSASQPGKEIDRHGDRRT